MSEGLKDSLDCWIYRSDRKEGMYLYLREDGGFDLVPEVLMKSFGTPGFVMQLALSTQRPLAQVDVNAVMKSLVEQGYFLQMPPQVESLLKHRPE